MCMADIGVRSAATLDRSAQLHTDVLVVGAGPVGLTLAANLARLGVIPLIVDPPRRYS